MYVVAFYSHFHTRLAETFSRRCYMPMFWVFLTIYDPGTIMTSQRQYYHRTIFVPIYLAKIIFAIQQLGDITENVNIASADTTMLFNFESPTTAFQAKHGVATTRELHTLVKLITFSVVDMATSPFAHPKMLHPLSNNHKNKNTQEPQIQDKVAYLAQTSWVK